MSGPSSAVVITASLLKSRIESIDGVEPRLREAMKLVRQEDAGWMLNNDEEQFKAAIGAVLLVSDDDTRSRINAEVRLLSAVSAAQSGIPVDFVALIPDDGFETVGLLRLWNETKGGST